eukprot:m.127099 g.127099  ORF g.127099 m.127099 type:complete len:475 (+) comp15647_c0_seq1:172-1596(+)
MALLQRFREYVFDSRLGAGTYGVVFRAHIDGDQTQTPYAVKCISRDRLNPKAEENVVRECYLLQKLHHPYIVQMITYEADANFLYIVMEFCSEGDLAQILRKRQRLAENEARFFLRQLASALEYLHSLQIAHFDLKPSNLLVYLRGSTRFLKVADFGFACRIGENSFHESLRGSPLYLAPEMLCAKKYDARADLWSIGVILFEVLFGRAPFHSETYLELIKKITSKQEIKIPHEPRISSHCKDLLHRLLQRNPDKRLSFDNFFKHAFVDLDHVPSAESIVRANESLRQGLAAERDANLNLAFDCFCDAVPHMMAAASFETDLVKEKELYKEAEKIIERAEHIKKLLRANLSQDIDFFATKPPPMDSPFVIHLTTAPELTVDLRKACKTAFVTLHEAFAADCDARYALANTKYQLSIQTFLDVVKGVYGAPPNLDAQTEIYKLVERYLKRSEEIQRQERKPDFANTAARAPCVLS